MRRAAQVLRPLGAEEAAARPEPALADRVESEAGNDLRGSAGPSALQNALRRSREVLDMLQRALTQRNEDSR